MKWRELVLIFWVSLSIIFPQSMALAQNKSPLVQQIEQAQGREKRKLILELLAKYSPNGYHIIHKYDPLPGEFKIGSSTISLGSCTDFMQYVPGAGIKEIVDDLSTAVHEICHGFTRRFAFQYLAENFETYPGVSYSAFYVRDGKTIMVEHTKTFESREIAASIPRQLRTFRFSTYITSSSEYQSTQVEGIYGLLDELNAYYHGTRTSVDFFNYYKTETRRTVEDWQNFFGSVNASYFAHLEFKYFILKYLRFAHDHHPQIYQEIRNNENFWLTFKTVDKNFTTLIQHYFNLKQAIIKRLINEGYEVTEDDEFIMIKKDGHGTGTGNFRKTYKLLKEELAKPEYVEIMKTGEMQIEQSNMIDAANEALPDRN